MKDVIRDWIGRRFIIAGHLVSSVGCRIVGRHYTRDGNRYCLLCGRLQE